MVRVKDKYAALYPFVGIVAEVIVLCLIIFICEKRRASKEAVEDEEEDSTEKSENSLKSIILYSRNIAFYHFRKLAPNQLNVGSLR